MQNQAATKVEPGGSKGVRPKRARGRPKLEDVAGIESKLLDVALKEFVKHGYGATSMTRIVTAAKVSKTTLYSRFSSKEDLFRAIMHQQIDRIGANAALKPASGRPDLAHGLQSYANRMLELSLKGSLLEVNRLVYSESHRFPELGAAAAERTEVGINQIADFIEECASADALPCRDPRAVAEAFIHMLRGWYVNVMLTNRKVSPDTREQWVKRAVHALLCSRGEW
jgi:TetR/AcrR family transcriptional repressor of mexJK operon